MTIIPIISHAQYCAERSPRHIAIEQVEERGLFMCKEAINMGGRSDALRLVLRQLAGSKNPAIATEAKRLQAKS